MSIEAMKLALEALEADEQDMVADKDGHMVFRVDAAITALRQAIEQAEQKPCLKGGQCKHGSWCSEVYCQEHCEFVEQAEQAEPAPMSQPNRLIAYSAADKLRSLGYQWDEKTAAWQAEQAQPVAYGTWDTMLGKGNRMMMVRLDKGQDGCTVPLYTAPPQRKPLTEWQLIGTAPKTGKKVVLFYMNRNNLPRTVMARWLTDEQAAETDGDGVGLEGGWYECIDNWDDYTEVAIHEGEPSHWMPLPQPPMAAHGIRSNDAA